MSFENSRLRRLALISLALQSAGRIEGRTKIQKIMYLANLLGWNAMEFRYHNYGPYSETLASELESMRNNGWIIEQPTETGNDRILYSYHMPVNAKRIGLSLIGKVEDTDTNGKKMVSRTRGLVKQLNGLKSEDLEVMSTLMFLKIQKPSLSENELVDQTFELKPQFSREMISKEYRIFNIMKDFQRK